MSIHDDLNSMFIEVINEYLAAAKMCIKNHKSDNGLLGYPATLLLFCTVEAMGANLIESEKKKIKWTDKSFRMLRHPTFGFKGELTDRQIYRLGEWFRHKLAHIALLKSGVALSPQDNETPFLFDKDDKPTTIYVPTFYRLVKQAWDTIDKDLFDPSQQDRQLTAGSPEESAEMSSAFSVTASGWANKDP